MVRTFFNLKAEEQKNPRPKDLNEDQAWNPLSPRREIIEAYQAVNFPYEKTGQDRVADRWYALVKGRPEKITQEIAGFYRQRIPNEGEYLFYNVLLRGEDWKGNEHDLPLIRGRYQIPIFRREKNPETDKVTAPEIHDQKTCYDIKWSQELFDKLLESAIDPVSLTVYGPGAKRLSVLSAEDYREGNIEDLIQCGLKAKSLATVLAEKNQFVYEKREQRKKTE